MKKLLSIRLSVSVLLGLITTAFIFIVPDNKTSYLFNPFTPAPHPTGGNLSSNFLIGCMHDGTDGDFKYITDTLGFNLWHLYCGDTLIGNKHYPKGWTRSGAPEDNIFSESASYITQVSDVLDRVNNHGMTAYIQRPKIEYLCYGQRSDYQCEDMKYTERSYWFYTFQSNKQGHVHTGSSWKDTTAYGGGVWVKRCITSSPFNDQPGYVADRLRTNSEQCNRSSGDYAYRGDSQCKWYIKPRIRIDSAFANNKINYDTPVCSIKLLNRAGSVFKEVTLRAGNFLVGTHSTYNGSYIDEFAYSPQDTAKLTYTGDWATGTNQWELTARVNKTEQEELNDTKVNRADIQVYWFGNCNMWIDYVRVDNDIANDLLSSDPSNQNHIRDLKWLNDEADIACRSGSEPCQFYTELFEFNQIPCQAYINHVIDSIAFSKYGMHTNVAADLLYYYQSHLNRDELGKINTPEQIKITYFDRTKPLQVFVGDPYPFMGEKPNCSGWTDTKSYIPGTLPNTSGKDILASEQSPEDYDTWLQGMFDNNCWLYNGGTPKYYYGLDGVFTYLMKHGDELSKQCNLPFIAILQAHQWMGGGEVDREPTTEETELMTNLAVSYGARGIVYWGFNTFNYGDCFNSFGIMDDGHPRYENVYGEPKLRKFKETVRKLKTWDPALMSFNNADRRSYIFRDENERYSLIKDSYFRWLVTGKPGTQQDVCSEWNQGVPAPPPEAGLVYDCGQNTYLQAATFKNSEPNTYYFMIVNRRCSPFYAPGADSRFPNGENGGRRKVKILFDTDNPQMSASVRWKITEVGNTNSVYTFSKTANSYVDLGWFLPGEGKLYKLEPAG